MSSQRTGVARPPIAAEQGGEGSHAAVDSKSLFRNWIENSIRSEKNIIVVDATGSPEAGRDEVLRQILWEGGHNEGL